LKTIAQQLTTELTLPKRKGRVGVYKRGFKILSTNNLD
jgi:hypothetical protein